MINKHNQKLNSLLGQECIFEEVCDKISVKMSQFRIVKTQNLKSIFFESKRVGFAEILFYNKMNPYKFEDLYSPSDKLIIEIKIFNFLFIVNSMIGISFKNVFIIFLSLFFEIKIKSPNFFIKRKDLYLHFLNSVKSWREFFSFHIEKLVATAAIDEKESFKILNINHSDPTFLLLFFNECSHAARVTKNKIVFDEVLTKTKESYSKLEKFLWSMDE